jgi:hypothetical protein
MFKNWEALAEFAIARAPDGEVDVIDPAVFVRMEATAILTAKLAPFIVHVNGGLGIERSTGDLVGTGVIGELPVGGGLRVAAEVNGEKPRREDRRDSGLLGLIWQPGTWKNIAFDAGIRRGFTSGVPDWQFTFGITFGVPLSQHTEDLASATDVRTTGGAR